MAGDTIEALRAKLAGLTGSARTRPLLELGRHLADRYWRAGPGVETARPYLDEAIVLLEEAYGYFEPGDVMRGQVASMLGWLVGTRYVAHFGPEADRERGITLLDESLSFPQLPQVAQAMGRMVLGQLLLGRMLRGLQSGDFLTKAVRSGLPPGEMENADRAADCFRQVMQAPKAAAEMVMVAETSLAVAEAVRSLVGSLGGGPAGVDFGGMQRAIAALQALQEKMGTTGGVRTVGVPAMPNLFEAETLATTHPLDRPVAVMDGPEPAPSGVPRPRARTGPAVDAAELRSAFRDRLPGAGGRPFGRLSAFLREGATPPEVGTVDELVALATSLVDAPGSGGTDHLLLAATLYLRSLADSGGWAGDDGADDRRAAAESLLAGADALPGQRADVVAAAFRLAVLLDRKRPSGELRAKLSARFAKVTDALRAVGAEVLGYPQGGELLLLVASTGRFEFSPAGRRLPSRVLLAGEGPVQGDLLVSYVRTGAQVVDLAGRAPRVLTERPVFVVNPRGDRESATVDADLVRRAFYPHSTGLGRTAGNVAGPGGVDDVRAHLRASMLHLGCGVTAGGELELAGGRLGLRQIAAVDGRLGKAGGLAVLPPVALGTPALADALLAANYSGVVGWRAAVPAPIASLMGYLLHLHLVEERRDVPSAVAAVRRWMSDPHRKPPRDLPAAYEPLVSSAELADPVCAAALIHHGVG